jgi:hypothetical protein
MVLERITTDIMFLAMPMFTISIMLFIYLGSKRTSTKIATIISLFILTGLLAFTTSHYWEAKEIEVYYQQIRTMYPSNGSLEIYNQDTPISSEWFRENILEYFPPQTYEGVERIIIQNEIITEDNRTVEGLYNSKIKTIYVSQNLPFLAYIPLMRYVLSHELAHHYWFQNMTTQQQKEWEELYNQTTHWGYGMTYAKTDYQEDFAEEIAIIMVEQTIDTNKEKIEFIQQNYLKPLHLNYNIEPYDSFYIVQQSAPSNQSALAIT